MSSPLQITAGDYLATIDPIGAGLHGLQFRDRDLVASYDIKDHQVGETAEHCSGSILFPWPNRTADGAFEWKGQSYSLPITEAERSNANHGLVLDKLWKVVEHTSSSVTLAYELGERDHWPWPTTVQATYTLVATTGLEVKLQVTNNSDEEFPYGVGFHPYLHALGAPLDESHLQIALHECVELSEDRLLPTGNRLAVADFLPESAQGAAQAMAGIQLDHCFVRALGVVDNDKVAFTNSEGEGVLLTADPTSEYVQIFTADPELGHGYPGVGRVVAVEPQTCPPDMLHTGEGLTVLAPKETFVTGYRLGAITNS